MNNIEKKSLYSFLILYIGSSFIFVLLSGFWYYSAQKNALENTTYYKMQHLADTISSLIVNAHMRSIELSLPSPEDGFGYRMIPVDKKKVYKENYFEKDGYKILVSAAPQKHLKIEYVVVSTTTFHQKLEALKATVLRTMLFVFLVIGIISWMLSKLFIRPIRDKIIHIEQFIQDVSHELNTPITALKMSSKRALQKQVYDEKILKNISISTKQLYSIYRSLAYLNFSSDKEERTRLDLKNILEQSIEYYSELTRAKSISVVVLLDDCSIEGVESRFELLFSNLLSNAIKYSMPNRTITLILRESYFSIEDEGIGIAQDKLKDIFKLYERSSTQAGGFGIGLNIVQQICDEYKITVQVESEIDKGSCFILKW